MGFCDFLEFLELRFRYTASPSGNAVRCYPRGGGAALAGTLRVGFAGFKLPQKIKEFIITGLPVRRSLHFGATTGNRRRRLRNY